MLTGMFTAVITLQITNQRVPWHILDDKHPIQEQPPLRDLLFDVWSNYTKWAFKLTETIGAWQIIQLVVLILCHKHRLIVMRRLFFCTGTLYFYRCLTTVVTSLPVPGTHITCQPKFSGEWVDMVLHVLQTFLGAGLQASGNATGCGGYLYSGHTVVLCTTMSILLHYTPSKVFLFRPLYWVWRMQLVAGTLFGMVCTILAHEHYTVDVIVSYWVTTRLIYLYHTMAECRELKAELRKPYQSLANHLDLESTASTPRKRLTPSKPHQSSSSPQSSSDMESSFESDSLPPKTSKVTFHTDIEMNDLDMRPTVENEPQERSRTHLMLAKLWWVRLLLWSEANVHKDVHFEYQNPLHAFVRLCADIKFYLMCQRRSRRESARYGYNII